MISDSERKQLSRFYSCVKHDPWSRSINLQALFFMVSSSSYEHLEADAQHCHYASYAVIPWYCETVNYVFTVCNKVKHSRGLPRLLDSTRIQRLWHGEQATTESTLEETIEYKKELFSKKKLEVENGLEVDKFIHELSFGGTKLSFFFFSRFGFSHGDNVFLQVLSITTLCTSHPHNISGLQFQNLCLYLNRDSC